MLGKKKIVAFVPIKDAVKAKKFYRDVLGLRFVDDDKFALVFDANGVMLRAARVPDFKPAHFTIVGWEVEDIEKTVKGLQKKGVTFEKYPFVEDPSGICTAPGGVARVAWFKDPDGNLLSISQH